MQAPITLSANMLSINSSSKKRPLASVSGRSNTNYMSIQRLQGLLLTACRSGASQVRCILYHVPSLFSSAYQRLRSRPACGSLLLPFLSQSRRLPLLQVVSNNKSFSVGVQSPTEINAPRGHTLSSGQWFCADRNEV